jgi:hypothetical protein
MPEQFLQLKSIEQADILNTLGTQLNRNPKILEKDIWICWTLHHLFSMPNRLMMAFKGGTSLSKVFDVIHRFSEDIDITLDYRAFRKEITENLSRSAINKISDELKNFVSQHTKNVISPYFEKIARKEFGKDIVAIEVTEDGEKVYITYPTIFDSAKDAYIRNRVILEFGGRNITDPKEEHIVTSYIANIIPSLSFPKAIISVLSPLRTFWEKATLIHVECHRGQMRTTSERLSRHWYDLAMLAQHNIGKEALADRNLLADVIRYKKMFFHTSFANYDDCLANNFRLVPNDKQMIALKADFEQMLESGMFYDELPSFDTVIKGLEILERKINKDK